MNIKIELLKDHISDYINSHLSDLDIDADKIADSKALCILAEVQKIIKNKKYNDFEVVEKIVELFEANRIYCGGRHDFS